MSETNTIERKPEWKTLATPNMNRIMEMCQDAQENNRFIAVAAPTGWGKTTALKHYVSKTREAFYVLCTVTMGRKEFLNAILKAIGAEEGGSIHSRVYTIIEKLRSMDYPELILDDCGKLTDSNLKLIQVIYDELEGKCGIILSGTDAFRKYLFKMAAKDKIGFRELKRRIGYWQPLVGITEKAIVQIAERYGINEPPAIKYIHGVCNDYGSLKELLINYYRYVAKAKPEGTQREILASIHYGDSKQMEAA